MPKNLQDTIQTLLNTAVAEERERGVQVAAYIDGKLAVDAWAGVADLRTGRAVEGDTLFPVYSTTKGIVATMIHILAERGQIDYDTPIATYWPEFGARGKEAITVRHALAHTAGIPYMPEGIDQAKLCDWEIMCAAIAQLELSWPAGEKHMYHAVTFGWILGEVARRVEGRHFQRFIEDEISRPLGLTGLYCGLPAEMEPKVAYLEMISDASQGATPPNEPLPREIVPSMRPLTEWMNRSDTRRACIPASNGIMSARAVARHYAALLPGGVDGVELLPPARVRLASEVQSPTKGYDEGDTWRRALGYHLGASVQEMGRSPTAFGHNGYGGSTGFADPRFRLAVSVTRNRFYDPNITNAVVKEIHRALGVSS